MTQNPQPLSEENFIPFQRADIIEMCIKESDFSAVEKSQFGSFCRLLTALVHFQFHERLETLKSSYAPFNPNADTLEFRRYDEKERDELQSAFEKEFVQLLKAANFEQVQQSSIQGALERESLFNIRLDVNFDDFDKVIVFRRGASQCKTTVSKLRGLLKREVAYVNFDRVVIYVRFKDQTHFDEQGRTNLLFQPGSTIIKLFKNVPRGDLEMLFPNSEVRMKMLDKLLIGVPAVISGAVVISSKLLTSLGLILLLFAFWLGLHDDTVTIDQAALVALFGGLAAVGGYLAKQFSKFKNRKIHFLKTLTENLYFKNLDNDAGVFHRLLDAAEESECKEAILAYYFMIRAESSLTEKELDQQIESWFREHFEHRLNFEVDDALAKLKRLGLVNEQDGKLRCKPLEEVSAHLDAIWDQCFVYCDDKSDSRLPTRV